METFTYEPSYSSRLDFEPRVLEAQFGDGYSQRSGDGINTNPQRWSLTFEKQTDVDADTISDFLSARGGHEAFEWAPPFKSLARFKCKAWGRGYQTYSGNTITAYFEQVFDL